MKPGTPPQPATSSSCGLMPTCPHVLVIGSHGMLGQDLMNGLESGGLNPVGLDLPEIDITRSSQVISSLKSFEPGLVINCAAYTAVDRAETEPGLTFSVNRDGPANLAEACRELEIPLIHISTDYVFDGNSNQPYAEEDPANPLGVYGRSKWEGEEAVRSHLPEHLIVRTAWLFGAHGPNFVKTILRLAREREELRVVADQHGCPTWTVDLADALAVMAKRVMNGRSSIQWGTYHFCCSGKTTWWAFADEIIKEGRRWEDLKAKSLVPIATDAWPTPVRRPAWSVLDCRKIEAAFGIVPPSWKIGLSRVVADFFAM